MKYLSVCSGIEAATVAWHGLGWEPVAFSEIEAFPAAVLAHHYPNVPNLGDLTKYREWPEELLKEVDLLVGGTPCQAFSVAGLRRSLDDERGNLSLTYVNLFHHINEARKRHGRSPAIALWENVPGVLSTKDNAFGCFIGGLLGCDEAPATESGKWDKAGFLCSETVRVGYRVLDAQYFGVAQRRRRVFLVAVPGELVERLGDGACPSEILSLRESVLGNPPARGAAREGDARTTAAGLASSGRGVARPGESRGQDDIAVAVDTYNQTVSETSIPVRVGNAKDSLPAVLDRPSVAYGGNRTSGPLDVATSCLANASPHGRQDFASETFVVAGHPDPAYAVSAGAQNKGSVFGSGRDSQDTFVVQSQLHAIFTGDGVIADPIGASEARTYTNEGVNFRLHNCVGQTMAFRPTGGTHSVEATNECCPAIKVGSGVGIPSPPAVCFKPSHFTRGKDGAPSEVVAPLSADADKGDQDNVIAYVKATNPHSAEEAPRFEEASVSACLKGWDERHDPPKHIVAFANRSRDGIKVPEVMKDGVVPALTNPGNGGRSDAVNVVHAMQVRRLCPTECEALQGFPIGYTAIAFRNKPAADGPRYRALGNSMAVPCMWWLGYRIQKATRHDSADGGLK